MPSRTRLAPEVDVRGEGGYVVCWPSLHPTGWRYEWWFTSGLEGWDDLAEFDPFGKTPSRYIFREASCHRTWY